ncbi:MAG: YkgJ family cysteine cluster protein [Pseudomonadota bacterium]
MHPCLSCGACCAHFRVGFHWAETEPMLGGSVPAELTERLDEHRVAMRGTWARQPRCVALDAEIGVRSRCSIHPRRPSVCREVPASWEFGEPSPQCDKARIAHGLRPLTPERMGTNGPRPSPGRRERLRSAAATRPAPQPVPVVAPAS